MDPRMRKIISEYAPNVQDKIRRYYIASGPIHDHKFSPKTKKKNPNWRKLHHLNSSWFDKHGT